MEENTINVAVIGATGKAGLRIVSELLERGHTVTGIARHAVPSSQTGLVMEEGDTNDTVGLAALLTGHDAVVSAVLFASAEPRSVIEGVKRAGVARLLVVGGAGSLEVAPGLRLIDTPDFPDAYKNEASAGVGFLDALRATPDLDWTFLSPSALFAPGECTGQFRVGTDQLLVDDKGQSAISMEDYAIALVNELETPHHVRRRFTVGY